MIGYASFALGVSVRAVESRWLELVEEVPRREDSSRTMSDVSSSKLHMA